MSWETLLTGNITFKEDLDYEKVIDAIRLICSYGEVRLPINIEDYSDYIHNFNSKNNGAHILLHKIENSHIQYELDISDINWSSHMSKEKMNVLRHIIVYYKDIIADASMSLYYIQEPDDSFYWDGDDELTIVRFEESDVGQYYEDLVDDGILKDEDDDGY